jgi:hypothetical protein
MIFGALYGLGNVLVYQLLQSAGAPEFYDKLLPVPILNVSIQLIDRVARSKALRWVDPSAIGRSLQGRQRHLAYIAVWAIVFVTMSAVQGVGDEHPGQFVPFWQHACQENRPHACAYLSGLYTNFCQQGSNWACSELGARHISPTLQDYPIVLRGSKAPITNLAPAAFYSLACVRGWSAGCEARH